MAMFYDRTGVEKVHTVGAEIPAACVYSEGLDEPQLCFRFGKADYGLVGNAPTSSQQRVEKTQADTLCW